jgi:uncharacterized protein
MYKPVRIFKPDRFFNNDNLTKLGILSDTHGYIDETIFNFFKDCDIILHAGDIGSQEVCEKIMVFKSLKAVYGNIDGNEMRLIFPILQRFYCEEVDILMTHIAGYPGKYQKKIVEILENKPPKLLIAGHSHILKIIYDKKYDFLFINPGAAGKFGLHVLRTAVRLAIDNGNISNLEILELSK